MGRGTISGFFDPGRQLSYDLGRRLTKVICIPLFPTWLSIKGLHSPNVGLYLFMKDDMKFKIYSCIIVDIPGLVFFLKIILFKIILLSL